MTKVHIKEGQFVQAGELLFTLDARNDEANVAKAQAQLAKDQAALADARAPARAQPRPVRAELHLAGRGRHQPDAGRVAAGASSPPTARRSTRRRSACRTAGIVAPAAGRAGAINVFAGSCVQPSRHAAGHDHPARPDRASPSACRSATWPMRWRRCSAGGAHGHGDAARRRRHG